jgi:hypothetical protein
VVKGQPDFDVVIARTAMNQGVREWQWLELIARYDEGSFPRLSRRAVGERKPEQKGGRKTQRSHWKASNGVF